MNRIAQKLAPPPPEHGRRRLFVALTAMAIIALRKHDSFLNPQFWAEDGDVFFLQAELRGWSSLGISYEGYLHFLPRIIAVLGRLFPLEAVPVFYAAAALIFTGFVAWLVQSPRIRVPAGWAGALAIAIIPHSGEVYLTICNLHWISAIALFALVLMDDPRFPAEGIGDVALLIVVGLTGPFIILALPFFVWRAWRRRTRWGYGLLMFALICATAHLPSLLDRPASTITAEWNPLQHAAVIGRRVWVSLFAGQVAVGVAVSATLAIGIPVALGWLLWRRESARGAWLLFAGAMAVLAATGFKARIDTWNHDDLVSGGRYFFTAKILFLWVIAALLPTRHPIGKMTVGLLLLLPAVVNHARFIYPPFPDQRWAYYAEQIRKHRPTTVPILPEGFSFSHPGRPAR